jgi:hypothetical protein
MGIILKYAMTAEESAVTQLGRSRCCPALPITARGELGEEQNESDDEAEDPETFSERSADERTGELAVGRGRIAKSARKEVAEDVAHAHCGEAHADAGEARAKVLESYRIHRDLLERSCDREGEYA